MKSGLIANVQLTVSDLDKSASFYAPLMEFFDMRPVFENEDMRYWTRGKMAFCLSRCDEQYRNERFVQGRVGLHHIGFRVRSRREVNLVHELALAFRAPIPHPPGEWPWAPGYFSVSFEDPDGIRLEVSHIPRRGLLNETMTVPIPRRRP